MGWILIILGHALANLRRCDADNWIGGCVVLRIAAKYLNSQCPFLDILRFPSQSLFHHKSEKSREALAMAEKGAAQKPAQLLANLIRVRLSLRCRTNPL
jgi:hypothetical protein